MASIRVAASVSISRGYVLYFYGALHFVPHFFILFFWCNDQIWLVLMMYYFYCLYGIHLDCWSLTQKLSLY